MTTIKNPIINDSIKQPKIYHPIYVCCVVDELSDYDANILAIRDYVNSMNMIFKRREYDSSKYKDDRDIIKRLPAYHIYIKRNYFRTFYPNTRPYQHIQEALQAYQEMEQRNEWRRNRLSRWYKAFISLFQMKPRKTEMERLKEIELAEITKKEKDRMQLNVTEW